MLQPRIISVNPIEPLKLLLKYETGEIKIFNVEPYAIGDWYGHLKKPEYFSKVCILPGGTGIEWPEGQDIAPHELYELSVSVHS